MCWAAVPLFKNAWGEHEIMQGSYDIETGNDEMDENMDFFRNQNRMQRPTFYPVEGMIVSIEPFARGYGRSDCQMFVTVEDDDGNTVRFVVSPSTYVADFVTLREGMRATFYYRTDAPVPLIYPPQYNAVVVVPDRRNGQFVTVGYFNGALINEEQTLQLNLNSRVQMLTTNNQRFLGSPANHDLVVFYETSTRSIPAQTTPDKIVVLCG